MEGHDVQPDEQQGQQHKAGVGAWISVIAWALLGGLFLLAWPMVVFGSIFLFDAPGPRPLPIWMFAIGLWYYPGIYISCLVVAFFLLSTNRTKVTWSRFYLSASNWACLPVLYVCILIGLASLGFQMMGW